MKYRVFVVFILFVIGCVTAGCSASLAEESKTIAEKINIFNFKMRRVRMSQMKKRRWSKTMNWGWKNTQDIFENRVAIFFLFRRRKMKLSIRMSL
jgi:hypothetical protein